MTVTAIAALADLAALTPTLSVLIRDHGADLPGPCFDALAAYYPSPVDKIVNAAEALYFAAQAAPAGDARDAFAVTAAQLADFCVVNQWHEIGQTDRGLKVSGACRRLVGLGAQDPADDPEALDRFAATE